MAERTDELGSTCIHAHTHTHTHTVQILEYSRTSTFNTHHTITRSHNTHTPRSLSLHPSSPIPTRPTHPRQPVFSFDRQISVDPPDIKGRKDIFQTYLKNLTLDPNTVRDAEKLRALGMSDPIPGGSPVAAALAEVDATIVKAEAAKAAEAAEAAEAADAADAATVNAEAVEVEGAATDDATVKAMGTATASGGAEAETDVDMDAEDAEDDEDDEFDDDMLDEDEKEMEGVREFFAQRLAALTPGFSGADIANICNEAAIMAAREAKDAVQMVDFEKATDRVIGGAEKANSVMTFQEKKTVAYHEAGHAIVGWFMEFADPLLKVTIVPRSSGALGFAQYLPKEVMLYTKEQLIDTMCMALGGRACEELTFGRVTTGASDDLNRVTKMAYGMVTQYGMSDRVGNLAFPPDPNQQEFKNQYSEATAQIFDEEAKEIVGIAYARTQKLLEEKQDLVIALAELLLEKETINQDDIISVLGARPFDSHANYEDIINASWKGQEAAAKAEAADDAGDDAGDEDLIGGPTMAMNEKR